ncbi:MAG: DUF433 domain-containing protein [Bacteroidetes bacterium]|nr:DUF433 domain-containing protein [Bacteroidota bacterium]
MNFENKIDIGIGIYTVSEISRILRLPYYKVSRWIDKYWDGELGHEYESKYSWKIDNSKAVSFHTLVEFYVMINLSEAGVKTREVLNAHKELSRIYKTAFPFAYKEVANGIKTDGKKIYLKAKDSIITLDGSKQLNLAFMRIFFKKLEFDVENLATRFWPLGKEKSIVIDPQYKFGHPTITGSNIYPETIYNLYLAKESIDFISYLYELDSDQVRDAIEYCKAA